MKSICEGTRVLQLNPVIQDLDICGEQSQQTTRKYFLEEKYSPTQPLSYKTRFSIQKLSLAKIQ